MSKINSLDPNEALPTINGNLEFDHNMKTQTVTVRFSKANTDQSVAHHLNKVNVNYFVCSPQAAGHIIKGKTSPTTKTIYVQSTVAPQTVTLILF